MKKLILIMALVLTGCATTQQSVGNLIPDVPEPPVLTSCVSTAAELPDSASDGAYVDALVDDYVKCRDKNEQALKALDRYRKPKSAPGR